MVGHEPPDYILPEFNSLRVANGYALAIGNAFHASHDKFAICILCVSERFHRALPACANRTECRMPAEVWQIKAQTEACLQKVSSRTYVVLPMVNVYPRHDNLFEDVVQQNRDCYGRSQDVRATDMCVLRCDE